MSTTNIFGSGNYLLWQQCAADCSECSHTNLVPSKLVDFCSQNAKDMLGLTIQKTHSKYWMEMTTSFSIKHLMFATSGKVFISSRLHAHFHKKECMFMMRISEKQEHLMIFSQLSMRVHVAKQRMSLINLTFVLRRLSGSYIAMLLTAAS